MTPREKWHQLGRRVKWTIGITIVMLAIWGPYEPPAHSAPLHSWHWTTASTYGYCGVPGEPCGGMACDGMKVRPGTWGVAHKTLPCGTILKVCVGKRCRRVRVRDRGPFVAGRDIDLTWRVGRALHIDGIARAKWRVIR